MQPDGGELVRRGTSERHVHLLALVGGVQRGFVRGGGRLFGREVKY